MGRFFIWRLLAAVAAAACVTAHAEIDPAQALALVQRAHVAAGLDSIAPQMKSAFAAQARASAAAGGPAALTDQEVSALLRAIDRAYRADRMLAHVTQTVAERTSPEDLRVLNVWFATASSEAVVAAEERAVGDNRPRQEQLGEGLARLQASTEQRRRLLSAAMRATRSAEVLNELQIGTAAAVITGLSSATPGVQAAPIEQVRRALKQNAKPQQRQELERIAFVTAAKTYENVADPDLNAFVQFLNSPAGRRFYEVMVAGFVGAMTGAGVELGQQMAAITRASRQR